jgi:hypothetical protein
VRQRLVDERHVARGVGVGIPQRSTAHERNLERAEVTRRDDLRPRPARSDQPRAPLDLKHRRRPAGVAQWEKGDCTGSDHSASPRELAGEAIEISA